jgi:hypothetical protein
LNIFFGTSISTISLREVGLVIFEYQKKNPRWFSGEVVDCDAFQIVLLFENFNFVVDRCVVKKSEFQAILDETQLACVDVNVLSADQ